MDIRDLIDNLAEEENKLLDTEFIAPCLRGGRVRSRVAGMIYTFAPSPRDFEGWGIFRPRDAQTAELVEEADFPEIDRYLQQFPAFRLRLLYTLRGQTWLAYPANEGDFQQRLARVKPFPVHLASEGGAFEPIVARWDGRAFWFGELDRRSDPVIVENLQAALKAATIPEDVRFSGITPEMRAAYDLVAQKTESLSPEKQAERRLQRALHQGGGQMQQFRDRGEFWQVHWTSANGERHTSAISKSDLTVMSAGICLSGRDRDFDLQSLVGVVEGRH